MSDDFDSVEVAQVEEIVHDGANSSFDDDIDFPIPGFEVLDRKTEETSPAEETVAAAPKTPAAKLEQDIAKTETPAQAAARILKFKSGDQALDIAEDAVIEWKVDGKLVPIKARELLDNFAGKQSWERKNQENANTRKALEATQTNHKAIVADMYEKVRGGKIFDAAANLIEMAGLKIDPREYVKQLRASVAEQARQLEGMTDEQRKVYDLEEEREYLKDKYAKFDQDRAAEASQKELQARMEKAAEQAKIPYDQFAQQSEYLKQQLTANGGNPAEVTPEYVTNHLVNLSAYKCARDAIAAVDPSLLRDGLITDEARWEKLAELRKAHKDLSDDEFIETYREARQKTQGAAIAKKLEKSPVSTPAKGQTRPPKAAADPNDFTKMSDDDLRW